MDLIYLPVFIVTVFVLFFLTYKDFKEREINLVYLFLLAFFSILYLGIFIFKTNLLLWKDYFIQIGISFVFFLIFFVLGKISKLTYLGEGDLYTLFFLSFTNIYSVFFILFVFLFALIITLIIPISLFINNLIFNNYKKTHKKYSFFQKLILMLLGYPKKINKIKKFNSPLETIFIKNKKLVRKPNFYPIIEPESNISYLKKVSNKYSLKKIWVSPLYPFELSILISYLVLFIIFDLNLENLIFSLF